MRKKLICVEILRIISMGPGKNYPGLSHEELMRSIRMVIAAILLAIPFPHSLLDWVICMTCLGPWFSRE